MKEHANSGGLQPDPATAHSEEQTSGVRRESSSSHNSEKAVENHQKAQHRLHEGEKVEQVITIMKPVAEVFAFWRDFRNLPKFMAHLERVDPLPNQRSLWIWRTIGGLHLEWESEIISETKDQMISWQTHPGSTVHHAGSVWFKSVRSGRATEVRVLLRYHLSGGRLTRALAQLLGEEPTQTLHEDLRRLRAMLEAGEVPSTEGQSHGSRRFLH